MSYNYGKLSRLYGYDLSHPAWSAPHAYHFMEKGKSALWDSIIKSYIIDVLFV
jgi:hypothetical protein